jgi:predicted metalloenzyme YecM
MTMSKLQMLKKSSYMKTTQGKNCLLFFFQKIIDLFCSGVAPNDIALFKMKTPLILNNAVKAIDLPVQGATQPTDAVLSGWGYILSWLPITPTRLQYAYVPLITNEGKYELI